MKRAAVLLFANLAAGAAHGQLRIQVDKIGNPSDQPQPNGGGERIACGVIEPRKQR